MSEDDRIHSISSLKSNKFFPEDSQMEKSSVSKSSPNISNKSPASSTGSSPCVTPRTSQKISNVKEPSSQPVETPDSGHSSICDTPVLALTTDGRLEMKRQLSHPDPVSEELNSDIDSALAEVVSGLKSLEMQQRSDKRMSLPVVKPISMQAKHTPDLVLDLPAEGLSSSPQEGSSLPDSPTNSTLADTFAQSNQGTLKKASSMPRNISATGMVAMDTNVMSTSVMTDSYKVDNQPLETHFMLSQPMLSTFNQRKAVNPNRSRTLHQEDVGEMKKPSELKTGTHQSPVPVLPPLPSMYQSQHSVDSSLPYMSMYQSQHSTGSLGPPPVAEKPKVPKVKPPVMKKPIPPPPAGLESSK